MYLPIERTVRNLIRLGRRDYYLYYLSSLMRFLTVRSMGGYVRPLVGAQFEGYLGEILALGAEISPYIGLREKWESP